MGACGGFSTWLGEDMLLGFDVCIVVQCCVVVQFVASVCVRNACLVSIVDALPCFQAWPHGLLIAACNSQQHHSLLFPCYRAQGPSHARPLANSSWYYRSHRLLRRPPLHPPFLTPTASSFLNDARGSHLPPDIFAYPTLRSCRHRSDE